MWKIVKCDTLPFFTLQCDHVFCTGVINSTLQPTFHSVTQVSNEQHRFSQNLHATAGQPHFSPIKPPYHLQPHQYTQPCGSNGKSGVSPVHQQQNVAPQGNLEEIVGIEKHYLFIGLFRY